MIKLLKTKGNFVWWKTKILNTVEGNEKKTRNEKNENKKETQNQMNINW